ncbi:MAG: type VI secretion system tube protein Hcp [Acetobacteraceae bacterium]|nr:type VI secretion system tube protein Hcp [Acetobacteraceae bacterium]
MALMFMKYEGIDGESEVRGRKGFMEIESFAWGGSRPVTSVKGGARGDAEVQMQEVTVTRKQDGLSAQLVEQMITGTFDKKVEFQFVRTGPNRKPQTFLKIDFEKAGLSSYQAVSSAGDGPVIETMSINYTVITIATFKADDTLSAVGDSTSFDVETGAPR